MKAKRPVGRPATYDKDYHPKELVRLMSQGQCVAQVCRTWESQEKHFTSGQKINEKPEFLDSFRIGQAALEASFVDLFHDLSTGKVKGSAAAAIFLSKQILNWSEKFKLAESDDVEFDIESDES